MPDMNGEFVSDSTRLSGRTLPYGSGQLADHFGLSRFTTLNRFRVQNIR